MIKLPFAALTLTVEQQAIFYLIVALYCVIRTRSFRRPYGNWVSKYDSFSENTNENELKIWLIQLWVNLFIKILLFISDIVRHSPK